MVDVDEFKKKIEDSLSSNVEFLGKNFTQTVSLLSDAKADKIVDWISQVVGKEIQPIVLGSKKPYKDWSMHELLVFRYPFSIGKTACRIILVKVKNSLYIEFHLGDHKYYDKVRKDLNLAKKSKR